MEQDKKVFGQTVKFRLENMVYKQHLEINHFARRIFCHLLVLSSPVTFWNMGFGIALCRLRLGLISCWFLIGQQPSAEYIYLVKLKSISFLISQLKLKLVDKPIPTFLPFYLHLWFARLVLFLVTGGVRWWLAPIRVGDWTLKTYLLKTELLYWLEANLPLAWLETTSYPVLRRVITHHTYLTVKTVVKRHSPTRRHPVLGQQTT